MAQAHVLGREVWAGVTGGPFSQLVFLLCLLLTIFITASVGQLQKRPKKSPESVSHPSALVCHPYLAANA